MSRGFQQVGILDYGVGNVGSLRNALSILGYRVQVSRSEKELAASSCLLLPGVGSMGFAMDRLRETGMDRFVRARFEAADLPIIGICLGMQLMFEHSEEGGVEGLGLIRGRVIGFENAECHVGWNLTRRPSWDTGAPDVCAYYFNHSYRVDCPQEVVHATAQYQKEFPAIVKSGSFTGFQFHPEKSQVAGRFLLQNALDGR